MCGGIRIIAKQKLDHNLKKVLTAPIKTDNKYKKNMPVGLKTEGDHPNIHCSTTLMMFNLVLQRSIQ